MDGGGQGPRGNSVIAEMCTASANSSLMAVAALPGNSGVAACSFVNEYK